MTTELLVDPSTLGAIVEAVGDDRLKDSQLSEALEEALGNLDPKLRDIVLARNYGASYRTLVAETGRSRSSNHRQNEKAITQLRTALANEPSVLHRLGVRSWEAAASAAATAIENEPGAPSDLTVALARLTELRDLMARAWVHHTGDIHTADLYLETGSIALAQCTTSLRGIVAVLIDKQRAYGPANILAFGNTGLTVRMSDKLERLKHLLATGYTPTLSEPLEDTWLDLVGYSVVGLMLANDTFELPLNLEVPDVAAE